MQMAEATLSVYEAKLRASMIGGVLTIAHLRARDAVKRELQGRGLKISHFSAKQISILAEEYFAQHGAELLNEAVTTVERLRTMGYLGKRAQAVRNPPRLAPPVHPKTPPQRELKQQQDQRSNSDEAGHPNTNDFGSHSGAMT
jgi:hypothetical protein